MDGKLQSHTRPDGSLVEYGYNARQLLDSQTVDSSRATTYYLYNGWNVELEHDGSQFTHRRSWGLDLSGSLQGAGGVGGLIMTETLDSSGGVTANYYPSYDGNGNITALIDSGATIVATWRYDAYGNTLSTTGNPELENYRFSTKPHDNLTGFYYYGYRYYDPVTGRWPSRDPLAEVGGPLWFEHEEFIQLSLVNFEKLARAILAELSHDAFNQSDTESVVNYYLKILKIKLQQDFYGLELANKYGFVSNDPIYLFDILGLDGPWWSKIPIVGPVVNFCKKTDEAMDSAEDARKAMEDFMDDPLNEEKLKKAQDKKKKAIEDTAGAAAAGARVGGTSTSGKPAGAPKNGGILGLFKKLTGR